MIELKKHFREGIEPYELQKKGIRFLLDHHYSILGASPGCGKTIMSVGATCISGGKTICVVPSSLKRNWLTEIHKYSTKTVYVIESRKDIPTNLVVDYLVVSYAMFVKLEMDLIGQADNLIFDECHYLCNLEAKRTQRVHQVVERLLPLRVMLLSGTAIKNNVGQFYSLSALCSYNQLPTSGEDLSISFSNYHKFMNTFSTKTEFMMKGRKIVKYEGMRNVPRLRDLLRNKYMTMKLEEIVELPPMVEIDVDIDIDFDVDGLLEELLNSHVSTKKKDCALIKSEHTAEYVKELLNTIDCVVIFTDHVESARYIHSKLGGGLITGSVPSVQRAGIVADFQNGRINVLTATIGSASTGFTLTRSSDVVFNDQSFSEADNEQARRRIYRISQVKKTRAHYMLGGPADKMIKKIVRDKRDLLRRVT